jgi:hypothetical protein
MTDNYSTETTVTPPGRRAKWLMYLCIPLLLFGLSAAVMLLWNAVLPYVLPMKPINYWQAMGLLVLCRILFGGFKFGGNSGRNFRDQNCRALDADQRAKLKEEWQKRCNRWKM